MVYRDEMESETCLANTDEESSCRAKSASGWPRELYSGMLSFALGS